MSSPSRALPLSSDDIEVARASSERLASFVKNAGRPLTLRVTGSRGEEVVELPAPAAELLLEILKDMAAGSAVAVLRNDAELTTQQAGDFLNVSRPFLVALLEAGTIPFRKVGTHRRVRFDDLRLYKDSKDDARRTALDELAADARNWAWAIDPCPSPSPSSTPPSCTRHPYGICCSNSLSRTFSRKMVPGCPCGVDSGAAP